MSRRQRQKKKKKLKLQKKIERYSPVAEIQKEDTEKEVIEDKPEIKPEEESIIDAPTRKLIAKDVRLIFITLFGLAILLVAIKILGSKTGIIDNFADWLYQITNINTT